MNDTPWGFYVVGAILFIIVTIFMLNWQGDCNAEGGVLVKGVVGYQCVEVK